MFCFPDNNITEESPRTPLFFKPQITQISADKDKNLHDLRFAALRDHFFLLRDSEISRNSRSNQVEPLELHTELPTAPGLAAQLRRIAQQLLQGRFTMDRDRFAVGLGIANQGPPRL